MNIKKTKKAFTLIELLVVIAIIALLLAILMPSLQKAKELAKMVVCMTHHKGMVTAWKTYSADNNGELVGGEAFSRLATGKPVPPEKYSDWTLSPIVQTTSGHDYDFEGTPDEKLRNEHRGTREGALYPYLESIDIYHCPADRRGTGVTPGEKPSFRSYSITASMNGERVGFVSNSYFQKEIGATKDTKITSPDSRFVFIDDFDRRGINMGSWSFNYLLSNPSNSTIADAISVWHFKKCNFSYADGHTESYVWRNQDTHKGCVMIAAGDAAGYALTGTSGTNEDVRFLAQGFRAR
jgi:prepilin-type N-terminal cleavage/methylation domain-containing protein/prepilin-type processing-associated H-X9-DG protein